MKFFVIEILDFLILSLFFMVLDYLKEFEKLDASILVAYFTIFKNSLIYFYLFKNRLNYYIFYIFRIILLAISSFIIYFLDEYTNTLIDFLFLIVPIIFLLYLIIKKEIKNKGIKIISVICYQILQIYLINIQKLIRHIEEFKNNIF